MKKVKVKDAKAFVASLPQDAFGWYYLPVFRLGSQWVVEPIPTTFTPKAVAAWVREIQRDFSSAVYIAECPADLPEWKGAYFNA